MWVLIGLDDERIWDRCRNGHRNRHGGLDVVVMNVSRIDMAVMGSDSIDCGCVGDLGMRIEGGHNGRVMETVAVDDDGVSVHCRGFILDVANLIC